MPVGVPAEVVALALFLCGIALVIVSVETFIESITESALELGVSGFFLTVVLAGADVENAIIGLAAVNEGLSGLALGTVFGEALFILAVAVGIAGVLTPFSTNVPRSYLLLVLGSPALLLVLALDGTLSQGDGAVLTVVFAPALGAVYLLERNRRTRYFAAEEVEEALEEQEGHEDQEEGPDDPSDTSDAGDADGEHDDGDVDGDGDNGDDLLEVPVDVSFGERLEARFGGRYQLAVAIVATAGMTIGSQLAVSGAEGLLDVLGVTGLAFGATVVGFVSSLEEIFLTAEPVRQGRPHIGVGNVVGSMLFFVTANPGVIALVRPLDVGGAVVSVHLPFFLVTLLLVTVLFWRGDVGRADGVFLLLIYVAYWGANYLL